MLISTAIKRVAQDLVAGCAKGGVIDERDARSIVAEIRARFPEVASGAEVTRTAAMSSLWHALHGSDHLVQGADGEQKVRVLPTADPTAGACEVLNRFAQSLPPSPGVETSQGSPLRFGDASRNFAFETPDAVVRRGRDGKARVGGPEGGLPEMVFSAPAPSPSESRGVGSFSPMRMQMRSLSSPAPPSELQLALAERWLAHTGEAKTPASLFQKRSPLANALKLFANDGDRALQRVEWHLQINSDAPPASGPDALPQALAGLQAYARALGLSAVRVDDGQVIATTPSGERAEIGRVDVPRRPDEDGWTRRLGRMLNDFVLGTPQVCLALPAVSAKAREFDVGNAQLGAHLASLAYQPEDVVHAHLDAMGYEMQSFRWLEDARTDTQGFVVRDANGHLVVSFRGTESLTDWKGNFRAGLIRPDWAPPGRDIKVHAGFNAALDSVWPQLVKALENDDGGPLFAGHSLGGALTQLALTRAVLEGHCPPGVSQVYTIGQPRVGNQTFADATRAAALRTFRLVNKRSSLAFSLDPVTGAPPKFMGYRHAGTLVEATPAELNVLARSRAEAALGSASGLESLPLSGSVESVMDPVHPQLESPAGYEAWLAQMSGEPPELDAGLEGAFVSGALGVDLHNRGAYLDRVVFERLRAL